MRIRTRSLIITLSQGLTQAAGLLQGIILVRIITQADLGTFRQTLVAYGILAGLLAFQFENSLLYFIPKMDPRMRRPLLAQTFLATAVMAVLIACGLFFAAAPIARAMHNPALVGPLRVMALYPFVDRMIAIIPPFMVSLDRAARAAAYSLAAAAGRVTLVIVVFALGGTVTTAVWGAVAGVSAVALIGGVDMLRLSGPGAFRLDRGLLLEQWSYTWPLWATALVAVVNVQFAKLLISLFFTPESFAVYSCGALEVPIISIVVGSVATATMPNLVLLAERGEKLAALDLWQEGARKCSLIVFPVFGFLAFVAADLIVLLYGRDYAMAAWPFELYLMLLPIRVTVYATLFRALGKTGPVLAAQALSLAANVALSTAITWAGGRTTLGFIGPALGAVLSQLVGVIYMLVSLRGLIRVRFAALMRWKELAGLLALCLLCGALVAAIPLPTLPLLLKLVVRALVFGAALLAGLLGLNMLKPDEKHLLFLPLRVARRAWAGVMRPTP